MRGGADLNRFILLYVGPPAPPNASHEGWPEWFERLDDRLVARGSGLASGVALHGDGSTGDTTSHVSGYCIIQAKDMDEMLRLAKDHPLFTVGREYSIEVYPLP
jgi:hypothetical protein